MQTCGVSQNPNDGEDQTADNHSLIRIKTQNNNSKNLLRRNSLNILLIMKIDHES